LPAAVVASDPELDLALLSVTAADLPYVPFGDSDAALPGQPTRVLGFPFGREVEVARPEAPGVVPSITVTAGRVSASRADAAGEQRFLQTDATVQPGSSGGPMLDPEGYAIGVVHSRLTGRQGAGFAIPINRVKDFLEANGYLPQLPARRLRLGAPQWFEWKGVRLSLPERMDDASPSRLRLGAGTLAEEGVLLVDRIATLWSLAQLEEAFLAGQLDGLPLAPRPSAAAPQASPGERPSRRARFGSAMGGRDGEAVRVEYALYDLGKEKLVARFAAPPHQVAFNLSVIQGSLRSLEAERLLTDEVETAPQAEWKDVTLHDPRAPAATIPSRFVTDETPTTTCPKLEPPDSLLSASPPGDFTVAFRVSFWARSTEPLLEVLRGCSLEAESVRFGVSYRTAAVLVEHQGATLRFEAEAPLPKWPFVEGLARDWLASARRLPE
jgi:hypothetical protein